MSKYVEAKSIQEVLKKDYLDVKDWQLDLIKKNPINYLDWNEKTSGTLLSSIDELCCDDLNEVVNFHFYVHRKFDDCSTCKNGLSPVAQEAENRWYNGWMNNLTENDVDVLWHHDRLQNFNKKPSAKELNYLIARNKFCNDSINRNLCVSNYCKRIGEPYLCPVCNGLGFGEPIEDCVIGLRLWVLYPRREFASIVTLKEIKESEVSNILEFLNEVKRRNILRFNNI